MKKMIFFAFIMIMMSGCGTNGSSGTTTDFANEEMVPTTQITTNTTTTTTLGTGATLIDVSGNENSIQISNIPSEEEQLLKGGGSYYCGGSIFLSEDTFNAASENVCEESFTPSQCETAVCESMGAVAAIARALRPAE